MRCSPRRLGGWLEDVPKDSDGHQRSTPVNSTLAHDQRKRRDQSLDRAVPRWHARVRGCGSSCTGVSVGSGANWVTLGPRLLGCLMLSHDHQPPALLPMLSRGKHRSPRKGACFMEFASLLAGERWSDHPACTHPLLAAVARHVNDYTSEAGRSRLVELIPSVVGLTGDDLHIDAAIALGSARLALPVAAAERQRVLAVGVLSCERVLADLDRRPPGSLEEESRSALARVPHAAEWAVRFTGAAPRSALSAKRFRELA